MGIDLQYSDEKSNTNNRKLKVRLEINRRFSGGGGGLDQN